MPVRIIVHGEDAGVHHVERNNLIPFLKAKAVEEAFELFWEQDPDKTLDELADVLEVVRAVCDVRAIDLEKIIALADKKRQERGGFEKGVVLIETRERSLLPLENPLPLFADQLPEGTGQEIPPNMQTPNKVLSNNQKTPIHAAELGI